MPTARKALVPIILWFSTAFPGLVFASGQTVIEDWDSTPPIPDQVRGWGSRAGAAQLESGLGTGNYARAQLEFIAPNAISVPWGNDAGDWLENDLVGDKDYSALGPVSISYFARHDIVAGFAQGSAIPTSIMLQSSTRVPSPLDPEGTVLPRIWTTSDNAMSLGEGWAEFEFYLPSQSATLPSGWRAWPNTEETWQQVISDVDQIAVIFAEYDIGIGGVLSAWDNAIDNFEVTFFGERTIQVNTMSNITKGLLALSLLLTAFLGLRHAKGTC